MKIDSLNLNPTENYSNPLKDKAVDGQFESTLKKAMNENDDKQLKKTCSEFESMFMKIIYRQMKSTVMKNDLIPDSNAKEMYGSMLDDKLAEDSAKAGGIGLGEMIYKQMKKDMINKYMK